MSAVRTLAAQARPATSCMPPECIDEMRLEVFASVPSRHIVFAVNDDSCMPMVKRGQVLVVRDAPRHYPIKNQWFLMQWITPEGEAQQWCRDRVGQTIGIPYEFKGLWGYKPPISQSGRTLYCGDGYWDFDRMINLIRGPVVGIYAPGGVQ